MELIDAVRDRNVISEAASRVLTLADRAGIGEDQPSKRVAGLPECCLKLGLCYDAIGCRTKHEAGCG
jgi:hypothetical protein